MAVPGHRLERLADEIRDAVAEMIATELKDPRIGFATLTRVDLSADVAHARVLVSVMGSEEVQRQTFEGLSSAAGYVRRELGRRLRLRRSPEVTFVLDRGAEDASRLDALLRRLKSSG